MHTEFLTPDEPTLVRLELLGNLAKAARLALAEFEQADSVTLHIEARPSGMQVDCMLLVNGQPVGGWGQ
jgi:hypothetical protein